MNTWSLRDQILEITHRWYLVLAFVLSGALLGWGFSNIVPSPYRATLDLYVGLNAYRSPYDTYAESLSGQTFRLVDDYKSWQMEQLNELVVSDEFIGDTLSLLQAQDPGWQAVSVSEFRSMVSVLWRNPGEWHLVVQAGDPDLAVQAVEAWGAVIVENVNAAVDHSKQVVSLDIRMTTLAQARIRKELRQEALTFVRDKLSGWREDLSKRSPDQPVPSIDHWELLGLISQVAEWGPAWDRLLDSAPAAGSFPEAYLPWLDSILSTINDELAIIPGQVTKLEEEFKEFETQYRDETAGSYGLASTLVVDRIKDQPPRVALVRPQATMSLVGGAIGFLVWVLWVFREIERRNQEDNQVG
jgi:hypothetical protein